jgi:hypothetical protein
MQKQMDATVEQIDLSRELNGHIAWLHPHGSLPAGVAAGHANTSHTEKEKLCKGFSPQLAGTAGFNQ